MSAIQYNRRKCPRFHLEAMHTRVVVHRVAEMKVHRLEGHAYDVSESGVRIELDEALEQGDVVIVHLELPGEEASLVATGDIVWVNDELDDPGPRRMAVRFTEALSQTDRSKLVRFLGTGLYRQAA